MRNVDINNCHEQSLPFLTACISLESSRDVKLIQDALAGPMKPGRLLRARSDLPAGKSEEQCQGRAQSDAGRDTYESEQKCGRVEYRPEPVLPGDVCGSLRVISMGE